MELKEVINSVIKAVEENDLRPSDDTILDVSGKIFNTYFIQSKKKDKDESKKSDSPATSKQIDLLKKLGIKHEKEITKKQASELIKLGLPKKKK